MVTVRLDEGSKTQAEVPVTTLGDFNIPESNTLVYVLERQGALPSVIGVPYGTEDDVPDANPGERVVGHPASSSTITFDENGDIHIDAERDVYINGTKQ